MANINASANIAALSGKTKQNYRVAENYYRQRKKMFLKLQNQKNSREVDKNLNDFYENLLPKFTEAFQKFEEGILRQVENSPNKAPIGISGFSIDINGVEVKIPTGLTKNDFINNSYTQIKREFGFTFEKVLTNFFKKYQSIITDDVNNFIAQHTGKVIQEGLTFTKGANVRSDFALRTKGKSAEKYTMELQAQLNAFEQLEGGIKTQTANTLEEMRKLGYLDDKNFIAGFSVKNYDENIEYTSSVPLQKQFNSYLSEQNIYGEKYSKLAYAHMKYFLSKYVIAISSPIVIGLITNKQFLWMYQVLTKYNYMFHLRFDKQKQSYYVDNSGIYLQEQKNLQNFIYSVWDNDNLLGKTTIELNASLLPKS